MALPAVIMSITSNGIKENLMFPSDFPKQVVDIVHDCWNMDPSLRPNSQDIYDRLNSIDLSLFS